MPSTKLPDHRDLPSGGLIRYNPDFILWRWQDMTNDRSYGILTWRWYPKLQTNITFLSIRDLAESSPRPCCSGSKALLSEVFRDFLIIIIIIQCTAVVKQCNVIPWAKLLTKVLLKKVFRPVLRGQCHQNRLSHSYMTWWKDYLLSQEEVLWRGMW